MRAVKQGPNTVREWNDGISLVWAELRANKIDDSRAKTLANLHGKAMKGPQLQIAYYALRKEKPQIDFLRDDSPVAA